MSEVAYPISQRITNLMASAKGALIMVVVTARKVRNTVISVRRTMGRRIPTTLVSVVHTILTEVGSIRVSPMSNGDKKTQKNFSQQLKAQQDEIDDLKSKLKHIDKKRTNEDLGLR